MAQGKEGKPTLFDALIAAGLVIVLAVLLLNVREIF